MPRRALVLALLLCAPPTLADEVLSDGIAAQVGTNIVLVSEVLLMVSPSERQMRRAGAAENEIMKLRAEGLEQMIEWRIIERVVRDAQLYSSDAEIDQTIEAIAEENGLSLEQMRASITSHEMGWETYRLQIKRELERRKVINAVVASQVRVEESEIRALYEERFGNQPDGGNQVHLRQLLVTGGEGTPRSLENACAAVKKAKKRISAGESFEELARELSVAAPQHGGDIGWLHEDSMADWMSEVIDPLDANDVSDVVELPFGCTLLKLVERRRYTRVTFERAKPLLQAEAFEAALGIEYDAWMEEMRSKTYIERRGYFAEAARFDDKTRIQELAGPQESEEEENGFLIP